MSWKQRRRLVLSNTTYQRREDVLKMHFRNKIGRVPRDIQGAKSIKDTASPENCSKRLEHKQVPKWGEPAVRMSTRSQLTCNTHCKCFAETTRNSIKVKLGVKVMKLVKSLIGMDFSNLPCLYSTFHLEYPPKLSRFVFKHRSYNSFHGTRCRKVPSPETFTVQTMRTSCVGLYLHTGIQCTYTVSTQRWNNVELNLRHRRTLFQRWNNVALLTLYIQLRFNVVSTL